MKDIKHSDNKKVIVFDLGGVILKFNHLLICKRLSEVSHTSVDKIYKFIFKSSLEGEYDTGKITSCDFYKKITDFLIVDLSFDSFFTIWTGIFEENFDVVKIISELKDNKYKLFLLSNTNEMHFNFVKSKFKIISVFDDYILSYRAGYKKPDINIFKEVLRKTGAAPTGHIYIDDIKENVIAAQSIGMFGIHFEKADKLKKDLADYLQI